MSCKTKNSSDEIKHKKFLTNTKVTITRQCTRTPEMTSQNTTGVIGHI